MNGSMLELSTGEMLSFAGLVFTAAAIVWRGGTLSSRLYTIERDVAKLVQFQENATGFITGSTADRAQIHAEIAEMRRRVETLERRCDITHIVRATSGQPTHDRENE